MASHYVLRQAGRTCKSVPEKRLTSLRRGSLRTRKYTDKDGVEKYSTEIKADSMQMLGSRGEGASEQRTQPPAAWQAGRQPASRQAPAAAPEPDTWTMTSRLIGCQAKHGSNLIMAKNKKTAQASDRQPARTSVQKDAVAHATRGIKNWQRLTWVEQPARTPDHSDRLMVTFDPMIDWLDQVEEKTARWTACQMARPFFTRRSTSAT
jgi:hypothetical protein